MKAIIASRIDKDEIISMAESFKLEKADKLPYHLTFYSIELLEGKQKELEETIRTIATSFLPLAARVTGVETTPYRIVRFSLEKSSRLQELHERIIRETIPYRDINAPSNPKKFYKEFSEEERRLIDLYGRPDIMQRFKPHITIGKTIDRINKAVDKEITLNSLRVYYL